MQTFTSTAISAALAVLPSVAESRVNNNQRPHTSSSTRPAAQSNLVAESPQLQLTLPLSMRLFNFPVWAGIFLALQLPTLIHTNSFYEIAFALSLGAVFKIPGLIWSERTAEALGAKHILADDVRCFAASVGCIAAKYFADHAPRGPWPQLIFSHTCSLDALALLFPTQFLGHWAYITHLGTTNFTTLLLQVPISISGIVTIWLAHTGYLNTSMGITWLYVSAILVWLAMADLLQHVTVAVFRYMHTSAEAADIEPESSTLAAVDPAVEKRLGTVKDIPKVGELSLDEIRDLPLPDKQKRASTRRRG